ncbi:hypothetical protein GCM10011579_039690 [Streptomyces albiflavescens]|uniref:Uncharacterized protein n=1 Tax=Streptomyces albiflavescens TaxID=1623582 RepID=A0A917Y515_9ACTN|nr:hypothetical protein [Streptomyces albiflavescens]GGN67292.1 hypothetical protein GCM10011579_039690 [Streptomyces albiflavescens]
MSGGLDPTGATLLLSLPQDLFVSHDREMCQAGAYPDPAVDSDTEYLSSVWGFTRLDRDDVIEVGDVSLVSLRVTQDGLAVDLAGYPWLLVREPMHIPDEWARTGGEASCLLGICFDLDLEAPDADERFLSELALGKATLGQVNVAMIR